VVVELVGADLDKFVSKTVRVTGSIHRNTKAISPAAYIISVRNVDCLSQQTCTAPQVRGCLRRIESKAGYHTTVHYVLDDQNANVVVELVGADLDKLVNKTVEATGFIDSKTKPIPPAAYVFRAVSVTSPNQQACAGAVGTAARQAPPGLSGAAKGGIMGGIAVGSTVGGLGAAGVFRGTAAATSPSPASR
jgi:hypothetical protein